MGAKAELLHRIQDTLGVASSGLGDRLVSYKPTNPLSNGVLRDIFRHPLRGTVTGTDCTTGERLEVRGRFIRSFTPGGRSI